MTDKSKKILGITGGLFMLWYAVFRGAKALIVRVKSYSFKSIDLVNKTVSLTINVLIKNPLLVGLTIKGISGTVYAQGVAVGSVDSTFNYYISGGRTHVLPVVVELNLSDINEAVLLNIQSGDIRTLTIAFNGKLQVGNVGLPLQLDFDYNDLVG